VNALAILRLCALLAADADADAGTAADVRAAIDASAAGRDSPPVVVASPAPPVPKVPLWGVVLVKGSRDPVGSASVLVDGVPAGETDADGHFSVEVTPGRHAIQVVDPGFESVIYPSDVVVGGPSLTLRLERLGSAPVYETVVRAPAADPPAVRLGKQEITKTPGSLGDPFRVIESLPGVTQIVWPLPIYAIRGANPGNTGFFVDGLRVPGLFHFAFGPAVIHPYFLDGLDFFPGSYPTRYGRHVAGVVAAATAAPPADRVRGSVDVRLYDAGAIVTTPVDNGRGTLAVAGRYAYPAGLLTALQDEVNLQYWDYQARFDHPLGPGRLTAFAFGSYDLLAPKSLNADGQRVETPGQRLELMFHRLDLRFRAPAGGGRITAGIGLGIDQTTAPGGDSDESLRVRALTMLPRLSYERPLGAAVDAEIGADGELTDYATEIRGNTRGLELLDFTRPRQVLLGGLYTGLVLRLGDNVVLSPGLRFDAYRESGDNASDLGPRLTVRLRASDRLWVKASGGRFSQLPTLPLQIPGFEGFGLRRHGLQTAWQGATGIEAALGAGLELDSSLFLHRYVLTDIRDPDVGDPLIDDFLTRREALSYGLEVMIRRPPTSPLYGWLSYTLSRSLRAFEGGVVGPSDWDQRQVLNLVAGYRLRRWTLGARFHVNSGRFVKISGTEPAEFTRLPAFYEVDLRFERRFLFDRFALEAYLEIINATLTREVIQLRQTRTGLRDDGFTLALPSLGLRAEF
jgi:hypothetical protein